MSSGMLRLYSLAGSTLSAALWKLMKFLLTFKRTIFRYVINLHTTSAMKAFSSTTVHVYVMYLKLQRHTSDTFMCQMDMYTRVKRERRHVKRDMYGIRINEDSKDKTASETESMLHHHHLNG